MNANPNTTAAARPWIERRIVTREPIMRRGNLIGYLETMETCGHTNSSGDLNEWEPYEKMVPCMICMKEART